MIAFAIASLALLVIPGPAVLYVINRSISDGRSIALAGVAGLELGNFVHVIAATIGLSALIAASATAFGIVKWIGAGYLIKRHLSGTETPVPLWWRPLPIACSVSTLSPDGRRMKQFWYSCPAGSRMRHWPASGKA